METEEDNRLALAEEIISLILQFEFRLACIQARGYVKKYGKILKDEE